MKYFIQKKHRLLILAILLLSISVGAQNITVSGTVTSDGETLIGANILLEGTSIGTITDFDGKYELKNCPENGVLIVSYLGYESIRVEIGGRSLINIELSQAAQFIDEIVVVGYGVQRKSDLTGSIASVKSEELTKIATPNVTQALQGKVAGVQVTPLSGKPGENAVIRIRGVGTLNNASPLFVVDGMFVDDISFLSAEDISSVEVLKDASATAIYGSRGANGVIIITTKGGNTQPESGMKFDVSASYGNQDVVKQIDMVTPYQYAVLANEVAANEGFSEPFDDPSLITSGTNWQNEIFRTAPMSNFKLAMNGSTDKSNYYISVNHVNQEGIIKGSDYARTTLRINNDYQMRKWFSFGHKLSVSYKKESIAANVLSSAYRADPTVLAVEEDGSFGNTSVRASVANPAAQIYYQNENWWGYRGVGSLYGDIKILKNLTFRSNLGFDLQYNQGKSFVPIYYVSAIQQTTENSLSLSTNRTFSWLFENTLNYNLSWKESRLNLLAGITSQENNYEYFGARRVGLSGESEELLYLNAGEIDGQTNYHGANSSSILSYLFRANYALKDRYLFTASVRSDGSSKFGENNRYGTFPAFAFGWNITNEAFMQNIGVLSRLKFRSSWGVIGNEKIGDYAGRAVVTANLNAVFGVEEALNYGASIIGLANSNIRWEETEQANVGFEFGFLNNRLTGEIDYYHRVTDGILLDVDIPDYIGSSNNPIINAATVLNNGMDLMLGWRDDIGDFNYYFNINGSTVNNEVQSLGEGKEDIVSGDVGVGGKTATRTVVGLPIGAFYGYETDGIFQNQEEIDAYPHLDGTVPGDVRFIDVNDDGVLDTDDRTYLGSPIPDLVYGFSAGAGFKGIDFSIDFNGQKGNKIMNAKKIARFGTYNFEAGYWDRWTEEGSSDSEPRVTNGGNNYKVSDRFLEDGAFIRLRNVQLGYELPSTISSKAGVDKVRVYVSATNLITWASYSGYTPEITSSNVTSVGIDSGVYPIAKSIIFGIQTRF